MNLPKRPHKYCVMALVIVLFVGLWLPLFAEARTYIADEAAESNQVAGAGDVRTEKAFERALSPLSPAVVVFTRTEEDWQQLIQYLEDGKDISWRNWPAARYVFDNAEPERSGIGNIGGRLEGTWLNALNSLANTVFALSKGLVSLGTDITIYAFNTEWVLAAADWTSDATRDLFDFSRGSFIYVVFILGLCGLAVMVIAYLLRAQLVRSLSAVLIAGLILAFIIGYSANSKAFITPVVTFTDAMAGSAMATLTQVMPTEDTNKHSGLSPLNQGLFAMGDTVWRASIVNPWAWGQFGTVDPNKLLVTESEFKEFKNVIPEPQGNEPDGRLGRADLEAKVGSSLYLDTLYLGAGGDDLVRKEILNAIANPKTDYGQHPETQALSAGTTGNAARHVQVAVLSLLPATAYFAMVAWLGIRIILYQLMLVVMLVFLPLVGLVALIPDTGWNIALNYVKKMAEFLVAKIFYGFYLGAVLFLSLLITSNLINSDSLGLAMFLQTVIFIGALVMSGKVFNTTVRIVTGTVGQKDPGSTVGTLIKYKLLTTVGKGIANRFGGTGGNIDTAPPSPPPPGSSGNNASPSSGPPSRSRRNALPQPGSSKGDASPEERTQTGTGRGTPSPLRAQSPEGGQSSRGQQGGSMPPPGRVQQPPPGSGRGSPPPSGKGSTPPRGLRGGSSPEQSDESPSRGTGDPYPHGSARPFPPPHSDGSGPPPPDNGGQQETSPGLRLGVASPSQGQQPRETMPPPRGGQPPSSGSQQPPPRPGLPAPESVRVHQANTYGEAAKSAAPPPTIRTKTPTQKTTWRPKREPKSIELEPPSAGGRRERRPQ